MLIIRKEKFRYRFIKDTPLLFDKLVTAFTYQTDDEFYIVVSVNYKDNLEDYLIEAKKAIEEQNDYFSSKIGNVIFQFSSIPWIPFLMEFIWGNYMKN